MNKTALGGSSVKLGDDFLNIGDNAPKVGVIGKDLATFEVGGKSSKTQVLIVVPSLDTPVCANETRKFNKELASVNGAEVSIISMDLPFAMDRFCSTEGIANLRVGSDFKEKEFAKKYGVLIKDSVLAGLTCRAIFIVDKEGKIAYKQIVPEITAEPNYDEVLEKLKKLA